VMMSGYVSADSACPAVDAMCSARLPTVAAASVS
jgi:hypothetical protein